MEVRYDEQAARNLWVAFMIEYATRRVLALLEEHWRLAAACAGIEQATYDREFWELVNAA